MLPAFDLLLLQALPEALEMLAGYAPDALPVAGGTNLHKLSSGRGLRAVAH